MGLDKPNYATNLSTSIKSRHPKAVKPKKPKSLEKVFNERSTFDANILNPTISDILLTPRSAKIVLHMGFNPELLKERTFEMFQEDGIDKRVQKFRYDAYENRRQELMKRCKEERKRLERVDEDKALAKAKLDASVSLIGDSEILTPDEVLAKQHEENAAILQIERTRMEKMKKRQAKDLQKMIDFEVSMVQVRSDMEKRLEQQRNKAKQREKAEKKRLKKIAEERRAREIKKKTMEDVEEAKSKHMNQIMIEKERELARIRREKEYNQRKVNEKLELEKQKKIKQQKLELQQYFEHEQLLKRQKVEAMTGHDEKKKAAMWKIAKEKSKETERKRLAAEKRIQDNVKAAEAALENKKKSFFDKQERSTQLRRQKELMEAHQRMVREEDDALAEERRRYKKMKQANDVLKKSEDLKLRFMLEDENVERVKLERKAERELKKMHQSVKNEIKAEVVARAKKIADFKREETNKRIIEREKRINAINGQREKLKEDRRIQSVTTALQKTQIGVVMEGVRTSASKAQKMIKIASTGKVKLEQLIAPKVDRNDAKRKSKKLKMRAEAEMSRMLRESQSAGEMYSHLPSFEEQKLREASAMYVSPYELPYDVGMNNSMEAALIQARKDMERHELEQGASL